MALFKVVYATVYVAEYTYKCSDWTNRVPLLLLLAYLYMS